MKLRLTMAEWSFFDESTACVSNTAYEWIANAYGIDPNDVVCVKNNKRHMTLFNKNKDILAFIDVVNNEEYNRGIAVQKICGITAPKRIIIEGFYE